jgi:glycosyltransferase involved in cell wall biosynthesis
VFSVLIPSYRHVRFLPAAVGSALRSPLVAEILIVDDGSRDGSQELIGQLAEAWPDRIRELPGSGAENRGAAARLEELVAAARADWLAVLNSDDQFAPGRFELLRRHCAGVRGPLLVCGHLAIADEDGRTIGTKRGVHEPEYPWPSGFDPAAHLERGEVLPPLAHQNFVATTSNMMFNRELHARVGGFRDYRYCHDWDFALRAAAIGACHVLPHYLTVYRSHGANTIRESEEANRAEVRRVFRDLLADFPELRGIPAVVTALRANRYLGPAWLAEAGLAA